MWIVSDAGWGLSRTFAVPRWLCGGSGEIRSDIVRSLTVREGVQRCHVLAHAQASDTFHLTCPVPDKSIAIQCILYSTTKAWLHRLLTEGNNNDA